MAKTVLLAEDSLTMHKVVEWSLISEGYAVQACTTVDDAVAKAKDLMPELVLADVSMEGKNGYDLCTSFRNHPELSKIPVILLHGSNGRFDANKAHESGAAGDIEKPFDTQALIEKITEVAVRSGVPKSAPMQRIESLSSPIESEPVPPPPPVIAPKAEKPPTIKPVPPPPVKAPPVPPAVAAPVEITIDAELPPPSTVGPLPSFVAPGARPSPSFAKPARADLPPPPPGMPLPPSMGAPARSGSAGISEEQIERMVQAAVAKITRETVEKIVWEVVPDLAERIIREHVDRLAKR